MKAMVYKNRQSSINLLTIKITKWGIKNTVVYNTYQRSDDIGREAITFRNRSIGDPFCGVFQYIDAYIP